MNEEQLQRLANALASDPAHKTKGGAWLPDRECVAILNGAEPVTISRSDVSPKEVLACILPSAWKALGQVDRDLLQLILAGEKPLDFASALTAATFDELFPAGTTTGDALLALVKRTVPATVAAYGREVTAEDVERGKRVAEGLHPDVRSPDEPVMAQLFAEKRAKEATDAELELELAENALLALGPDAKEQDHEAARVRMARALEVRDQKRAARDDHPVKVAAEKGPKVPRG